MYMRPVPSFRHSLHVSLLEMLDVLKTYYSNNMGTFNTNLTGKPSMHSHLSKIVLSSAPHRTPPLEGAGRYQSYKKLQEHKSSNEPVLSKTISHKTLSDSLRAGAVLDPY